MKEESQGRDSSQTKIAILIQLLNSFIGGVLFIVLPLLMEKRQIDIVTMGLIFSSLPLIFQLTRMSFAIFSDLLGRKPFFTLNGLLNVLSGALYYAAYSPLQFLVGKITEGTKNASLWAVNRAFLLEESGRERRPLVQLRTSAYISMAGGALSAGALITWFSFANTLLICTLVGTAVIPISLLLTERKEKRGLGLGPALQYLDLRNKERLFTIFVLLFFVMGLSLGFKGSYVFPLFLKENRFGVGAIGVFLGAQMLLAGVSSFLFANRVKIEKLILLSGLLYSFFLLSLGFSPHLWAAFLVIIYGIVDGLLVGVQEGIVLKITRQTSYGTDIGLLMMGLHAGTTTSLALSGFLIARWGFVVPFLLSALIFSVFYSTAYLLLREGPS